MDLRDLFHREDRFGEFNENTTFYMNLQGLASALETVHNLRLGSEDHQFELARIGYHHDICPRNILVSEQKLLLTDFGLAAMKPVDENSQTEWKSGMGDYIAPESMAADLTHQKVGRKLDIWSFGCLTTDIIAYIERGPTGVEMASDQRLGPSSAGGWRNSYFYTADSVKPNFLSWMRELCEESVHEELSCFLDEAIHVLQISPVDRPSAEEVRKDMAFLAVKAVFAKAQVTVMTYYRDLEAKDVPGLPLVDVWFEKERLNSWGSVLEISTRSSRSESFDGSELLATNQHIYPCQEILLRLIQQFGRFNYSSSTRSSATHFIQRNATLRDLVGSLWSQLPAAYLKRIDAIWKRMLTRTDKLDELQARGKAGNQEQYKEAAALASMKALRLALSNEIELGNHDDLLLLDANNLRLELKSTGPRIGFYDDKSETPEARDGTHYQGQVLAEIMTYNPAWDRQTPEEKITKIGALAALLHHTPKPQGFRVLDCLGFLDLGESNGFTLLFTFPYSTRNSRHTTQSLSETLSLQYQPSLQDKISLAQVIATSLYELHNAGWLHKAICSDNILFFREDNLRSQAEIREPYLVNFRHSRPDGTVWVSEGPGEHLDYYHPEYLAKGDGGGFKKIYDYYSVGLVLLEIGFWKPLSDFSSQHKKPGTFRRILIDKYVPKLDRFMGGLYQEAVRTCLEDTGLGDDDDLWLSGFYKKVVEPLMRVNV